MDDPWLRFVVALLATWRLAHLFAHEDGPWDVVVRLRASLGNGALGHLLDCFNCVSLWVSIPLAFFVGHDAIAIGAAWLGLSGGACLLDRLGRAPLMIQPMNMQGGDDALLRPEADGVADEQSAKPAPDRAEAGHIRAVG
jgi:hypothetical protein